VTENGKVTLTERAVAGLFCVQRYRFLTIDQFARASGLHRITAANKLLFFQQCGVLSQILACRAFEVSWPCQWRD